MIDNALPIEYNYNIIIIIMSKELFCMYAYKEAVDNCMYNYI